MSATPAIEALTTFKPATISAAAANVYFSERKVRFVECKVFE
jgi:hypothetical protein